MEAKGLADAHEKHELLAVRQAVPRRYRHVGDYRSAGDGIAVRGRLAGCRDQLSRHGFRPFAGRCGLHAVHVLGRQFLMSGDELPGRPLGQQEGARGAAVRGRSRALGHNRAEGSRRPIDAPLAEDVASLRGSQIQRFPVRPGEGGGDVEGGGGHRPNNRRHDHAEQQCGANGLRADTAERLRQAGRHADPQTTGSGVLLGRGEQLEVSGILVGRRFVRATGPRDGFHEESRTERDRQQLGVQCTGECRRGGARRARNNGAR